VGFNFNAAEHRYAGRQTRKTSYPNGLKTWECNATHISVDDSYLKRRSNAGYASAGIGLFDQLYLKEREN